MKTSQWILNENCLKIVEKFINQKIRKLKQNTLGNNGKYPLAPKILVHGLLGSL